MTPDPYWQAVIDALRYQSNAVTAGPDELKCFVPGLLSLSEVTCVPQRLVCHKGMIDRLPQPLLAACLGRATVTFANEVFVVFEISEANNPHARALEIDLARRFATPPAAPGPMLRQRPRMTWASAPRVVAALQSPTLLNVWARSSKWKLEVAELGDHEELSESALLDAPRWDGRSDGVVAVLVTSPAQLDSAEQLLPKSARIWVLHRAQAGLLPPPLMPRVDGIVTLSRRVRDMQRALHPELLSLPSWIIPPSYSAAVQWTWRKGLAWMMQSRPATRSSIDSALVQQTVELLRARDLDLTVYGQDTAGGFLDAGGKAALREACSCYVSPLPPWAGFGLAQHECMAAGVPIAGLTWGDLSDEMLADYTSLCEDLDSLAAAIERLCLSENYARTISAIGLDYIAGHRTRRTMDDAVERFADTLPPRH